MDHQIRSGFVSIAIMAIAACATTETEPAREAANTASDAGTAQPVNLNTDRPAMWRLADSDSEIFLFGTFHVLPPNVEWTSTSYNDAMVSSENTIVEADISSPEAIAAIQSAVAQHGLNPPGVTLTSVLGAERAAELETFATELGVPFAALEPMRPWLALISLTQVIFQQSGFDPSQGVETAVLAQATAEGDQVSYLETATSQIEVLASLDGEDMLANFDTTFEQFEEFDDITQRLLDAWRTGDVEGLENDILKPLREISPGAYDKLFTKRNITWTGQIEELLAGEGDYFIAVGAGHLVGEDSVVDMLRKNGVTVDRVQ